MTILFVRIGQIAPPVDEKVDSRVDDGGEVVDISQLIDPFCRPGSVALEYWIFQIKNNQTWTCPRRPRSSGVTGDIIIIPEQICYLHVKKFIYINNYSRSVEEEKCYNNADKYR